MSENEHVSEEWMNASLKYKPTHLTCIVKMKCNLLGMPSTPSPAPGRGGGGGLGRPLYEKVRDTRLKISIKP